MTACVPFVYLASQSPRRQDLLRAIGVRFELLAPDDDEDVEALEHAFPGEAPARYVRRVTLAKLEAAVARRARRALPPAPILVADTTVALGGTILGKPADARDAIAMLERLSGRSHRVLSGVALLARSPELRLSSSRVRFARIDRRRIERYVATGEPFGKAGAYAIQGLASTFVRGIEGSHSGIMGLPLFETGQLLRRAGITLP